MGAVMRTLEDAMAMVASQPVGTIAICVAGAIWIKVRDDWWLRHSAEGTASNPMYDHDLAKFFNDEGKDAWLVDKWMLS